ncbi:amidohydrolase [Saccharomonospora viridis]|uniref:Amidohydrolase n=2 Tax=Saccharomonospora viridis TaxID=1852 RepID=C7MUT0_SACVD|nr:amidohydrolase [Saccharomonospora viridis]ACU95643.1 amidohydrolase [Saccharomonospora viridis DSM 43017]KHF43855.1 N-acyl-L-amino acid amidohydrolase [Saccharomonospora viridis]SFP92130.1 amidohydrolase [Saccharomonospora viridis]
MTVLDSRPEVPGESDPGTSADSLLAAAGTVAAGDVGAGRGPDWLDDWLADRAVDVVSWRRHIHAHPELARREYGTTELIVRLLRSAGLQPRVLPGGTGLICDVGTGRRCVALRADLDALPLTEATGLPFASSVDGVAHACGHDVHTTVLLGAGLALATAAELPGRVRLLFQPAEEVMPGGALDAIEAGALDGVDRIFGLHCDPRLAVGRIGTRVGALTSAADLVELTLTSPGGHTSRPHLTADLVHGLGTVITSLPALLSRRVDPRSGTVLVWGAVHAGEAANAVPQEGRLCGTLRTADHETWTMLEPLVESSVKSLLAPTGVGYELNYLRGVPPVVNDSESTALLRVGVEAALGAGALANAEQSSGGEDFGWYLEHVPGAFARLGVWSGEGQMRDLHQPTFVADERALFVGIRVMVHAALAALAA